MARFPLVERSAAPTVAVSIVSHGDGAATLALLRDLARHARGSVARIVLTVNLPEPSLEAAAAAACGGIALQLRRNARPRGFGENHNAAFAEAGARTHFAVINPDVRLRGDPFPALCAELARDARVGCAYPTQFDAFGQPCNPPRPVPTVINLLRRYVIGGERRQPAAWVNAAFVLYRRDAFNAVGGFDSGYRLYCEDVDICLRLQLADWRLAAGDSAVQHAGRRSSHGRLRHLYWHLRSLLRLWRSPVLRAYRSVSPNLAARARLGASEL